MEKFIARAPVTVRGRDYRGGDTFEAELADVAGLLESTAIESVDGAVQSPVDRTSAIVDAIGKMDAAEKSLWTNSGAPKVPAIEAITGWQLTANERDVAWAQIGAAQ